MSPSGGADHLFWLYEEPDYTYPCFCKQPSFPSEKRNPIRMTCTIALGSRYVQCLMNIEFLMIARSARLDDPCSIFISNRTFEGCAPHADQSSASLQKGGDRGPGVLRKIGCMQIDQTSSPAVPFKAAASSSASTMSLAFRHSGGGSCEAPSRETEGHGKQSDLRLDIIKVHPSSSVDQL